jgi:hypothetical protein
MFGKLGSTPIRATFKIWRCSALKNFLKVLNCECEIQNSLENKARFCNPLGTTNGYQIFDENSIFKPRVI